MFRMFRIEGLNTAKRVTERPRTTLRERAHAPPWGRMGAHPMTRLVPCHLCRRWVPRAHADLNDDRYWCAHGVEKCKTVARFALTYPNRAKAARLKWGPRWRDADYPAPNAPTRLDLARNEPGSSEPTRRLFRTRPLRPIGCRNPEHGDDDWTNNDTVICGTCHPRQVAEQPRSSAMAS